jgi:aminomethyltransferase
MPRTPLYSAYAQNGAKIVNFHGWELPLQFDGIVQEHLHTRAHAGVFDCSHMGEFVIHGKEALDAFDSLVFSDLRRLPIGRCRYSAFLNENGGVIDDCVFVKLDPETVYLVTNAAPLDTVRELLHQAVLNVEDVSDATVKIDVQGPTSRAVLLELGFDEIASMRYWTGRRIRWQGNDLVIFRAGYTGELGYEIFLPAPLGCHLWQRLLEHPEVKPCGLGARDTLRLETSKPLNGVDLSPELSPLQCGMEKLIAWDKDFVGKEALLRQRDEGGYSVLTPIVSLDRRAPREGQEVHYEGRCVGRVTSGSFGPSLGVGVGFALVPQTFAKPGTRLLIPPRAVAVETAEPPVYKHGTCALRFPEETPVS